MKNPQKFFLLFLVLGVAVRIAFAFLLPPTFQEGQRLDFLTTLLTEPITNNNYDSLTVSFSNGWSSVPLHIFLRPGSGLHYGQTVAMTGTIQTKSTQRLSNGRSVVPGNTNTMLAIYFPKFTIKTAAQNPILSLSFGLREKIKFLYERSFSPRLASLLLGIVLGVRGNFPKNFLTDLQATGVMHVIAASGMNVTMVSGFFLGVFGLILKRQWAILATIAVLLFYCVVSGLQASILRATIMIGFALFGQLFGRQYNGLYGLLLAACGMLLYNPLWILDIGFELSFASTLGIFFLKPLLPEVRIITDDIGTTITAQLATLPILLTSFGSYGVLSVLVNALVLWTVPPLMVLGGIGGLLGLLFEPLGQVLLFFCVPFLWFFEKVIVFFGGLQWQISLPNLPIVMAVGYYLMLGSITLLVRQKNQSPSL